MSTLSHTVTANDAQAAKMQETSLKLAFATQPTPQGTLYFDSIEENRVILETIAPDGTYTWLECYIDGEWSDPAGVSDPE